MLFSIRPNRSLFTTGTGAGCGTSSACGTSVANSVMVAPTTADEYRPANTHLTTLSTPAQRRTIAPSNNLQLAGWRLSANTVKQQNFQTKLERFCCLETEHWLSLCFCLEQVGSWCSEREANPLSAFVGTVLEFLTVQFNNGKAYRSINVYQTA